MFKTDDEVTKAQATLMYVDLIRKISVENEEQEKKEGEKIKKRAELQKALCSMKADQILEKTVKQIMHENKVPGIKQEDFQIVNYKKLQPNSTAADVYQCIKETKRQGRQARLPKESEQRSQRQR